jgi:L-aspartate oxidase
VVPAAHYTCGGIVTDLNGLTDMPGLYAVGETTYTGCTARIAWPATRCSNAWCSGAPAPPTSCSAAPRSRPSCPPGTRARSRNADEQVVIAHNWDELRLLMWNYVGIVRTTKRLGARAASHQAAAHRDRRLLRELPRQPRPAGTAQPGRLRRADREIGAEAHESRGLHYSRDFPHTLPVSFPTVLLRAQRDGKKPKAFGLSG